jgi:hypothetical protein
MGVYGVNAIIRGQDVAQICMNGHMINDACNNRPQRSRKRCPDCGEVTITTCPHCGAVIPGHYFVPGVASIHNKTVHKFCCECGKPYPWTERKKAAAIELFAELLGMEKEQQEELGLDLDAIATDQPRTQVATVKVMHWIAKAGKESVGMLRDLVVDIASEAAKKVILEGKMPL